MVTNSRIEMHFGAEEKELLVRAATISGKCTTKFIREAALERARRIVDEAENIMLSAESYQQVLDLLDKPPEPNQQLLKAYHDYKDIGL